jgi:hypothetical protein
MRIGMIVDGCKPHVRGISNDIPLHERPRDQAGLPVAGVQSVGVGEPDKDQKTGFLRSRSFLRRSELRLPNFFGKQQP